MIALARAATRTRSRRPLEPGEAVRLDWPGRAHHGMTGVVSLAWPDDPETVGVVIAGLYYEAPSARLRRVKGGRS